MSPAPASVTGRALAVLGAFDTSHPVLTLSELSRRANLPLTTVHRLTTELTRWGALERDDERRYRIGLRLWEVGSLAPRPITLREAAMPYLEDLHAVTRENVQLAVLDGTEALYVERISAPGAVTIRSRAGSRLPLHATGVGLVLLAFAPAEVQERVLAGPLKPFTAMTVVDPGQLRRRLAEVRRTQVAVCDRQIEMVSLSVAAPVFGAGDEVVAALSVVVRAGQPAARLIPVVRAAARGVTRSLGTSGRPAPRR